MKIKTAYEIILAEDEKSISHVQICEAGKFEHWDDSTFEITKEMLQNMKINFDNNVKKIDLAIDYFHASHAEAAGWIKAVNLENEGTQLWCDVDWTENAKAKILSKEVRYLSIDYDPDYKDNKTGKKYGATLNGAGLTNRPFIKGMNPILSEISAMLDKHPEKLEHIQRILASDAKKGSKTMDFSEIKQALVAIKLSDEDKNEISHLIGIEKADKKLSEENVSLKAAVVEREQKIVTLSEEISGLKKDAEFAVLLSEGKAVPAQKESYMKGDMAAFVKLSVPVNFKAGGTGNGDLDKDDEIKDKDQAGDKVTQLAEEKCKADKDLSFPDAVKIVLSENEALKKIINS